LAEPYRRASLASPAIVWPASIAATVLLVVAGCAPKRVGGGAEVRAATRTVPPEPERREPESPAGTSDPVRIPSPEPLPVPEWRPRSGAGEIELSGPAQGVAAAELAIAQLGKPYAYGAAGPDRFDCSGLVYWVYAHLDVRLPRVARNQVRAGRPVSLSRAQPGDLLFFSLNHRGVDHVGVYLGDGRFVHAPRRGRPVSIDRITESYWRGRLREVRRVVFPQAELPTGED
jgi:cell wall-associated NlpC family hydrolase